MKKLFIFCLAVLSLAACKPDEPVEQPSEEEQALVPEEMVWQLDSIKHEFNIDSADYYYETEVAGEDITPWIYYLYPYTWSFPSDMVFTSDMSGEKIKMSKSWNNSYCKYIMKSVDGDIYQAGYVELYNGLFCFYGVKQGGWIVVNILNDVKAFGEDTWQFSFNNSQDPETGAIYERQTEYYHKVAVNE